MTREIDEALKRAMPRVLLESREWGILGRRFASIEHKAVACLMAELPAADLREEHNPHAKTIAFHPQWEERCEHGHLFADGCCSLCMVVGGHATRLRWIAEHPRPRLTGAQQAIEDRVLHLRREGA